MGGLQSMFMDQVEALDGDAPEGRLASAVEPPATALRKFDALGNRKLPSPMGNCKMH